MPTRALTLLGVVGVALQPSRPPHHPRTRRHVETPPPEAPPTPPTPPPPKPVTGPWQWSPDQKKAETEVAAWRRSVTSADFDDALV